VILSAVQKAMERVETDGQSLLVAVSGGADSMTLLYCLNELGYNCVAFTFDHLWRNDTEEDIELVRNFCKQRSITFATEKALFKGNNEEEARNQRWQAIRKHSEIFNCSKILIAHNANDRVETFLINFMRGSGLDGLTAMPGQDNNILRPLVACSATAVREFADENNIPYRIDTTNSDTKIFRNLLRKQLEPFSEKIETALHTIEILETEKIVFDELIEKIYLKKVVLLDQFSYTTGLVGIALDLSEMSNGLMRKILRKGIFEVKTNLHNVSSALVDRIINMFLNPNCNVPTKHTEIGLTFYCWNGLIFILNNFEHSQFEGKITIEADNKVYVKELNVILQSYFSEKVVVRARKKGEKIGTKSLKKYLSENKILPFVKDRIPIIVNEKDEAVGLWPSKWMVEHVG
jgi:tRNA(Ile)-lysidine synthetase-like protein